MKLSQVGLILLPCAVLGGCPSRAEQPSTAHRAERPELAAHDAGQPAQPSAPLAGRSPRDQAIEAALTAHDVHAAAIVDAPLDVDGDGVADTVFHTENPVAYGFARTSAGAWRVDVLQAQTAPQEWSTWGPSVPLAGGGAALLLVRSLRPAPTELISNQSLEVRVTRPGAEPSLVYAETYPTGASWTMRAPGADALELHGTPIPVPGQPTGPDDYKTLHRSSPTEWLSASCWGAQAHDAFPGAQNCTVVTPAGTEERRFELYPGGPPIEVGSSLVLLYPGAAPPPRRSAFQNWCVALPNQHTAWAYLMPAVTARCTPQGLRR